MIRTLWKWLFEKPRHEVDTGLWFRRLSKNEILVEASPAWYDGNGDDSKVSADSRADFKRVNAVVSGVTDEGDAQAVCTVIWNWEAVCPECGENVFHEDRKCEICKCKLWKTPIKMTLVKVEC